MDPVITRKAEKGELFWINSKYSEVDFMPSNFETEFIVIAEINGTKCGIGRLVQISNEDLELGGIYVFPAFRNQGVAEKLVAFLCDENSFDQQTIWCLPFEHLESFYNKLGFLISEDGRGTIPPEILKKHKWCNSNYGKNVLLLTKNNM
jgi:GNAT superfamily N-acetyltransferase